MGSRAHEPSSFVALVTEPTPSASSDAARDPRGAVGGIEVAVVTTEVELAVAERRQADRANRRERLARPDWRPRRACRRHRRTAKAVQRVVRRVAGDGAQHEACRPRRSARPCAKIGPHVRVGGHARVAPLEAEEVGRSHHGRCRREVVVGRDHVADRSTSRDGHSGAVRGRASSGWPGSARTPAWARERRRLRGAARRRAGDRSRSTSPLPSVDRSKAGAPRPSMHVTPADAAVERAHRGRAVRERPPGRAHRECAVVAAVEVCVDRHVQRVATVGEAGHLLRFLAGELR